MASLSNTRTPSPPSFVPSTCSADPGAAGCYSSGHQTGYWWGYKNGWDDFFAGKPGARQMETKPADAIIPGLCLVPTRVDCFRDGYGVGYSEAYPKGLLAAMTA